MKNGTVKTVICLVALSALITPASADNDALVFNGFNNKAIAPNSPDLNPSNITVECWFLAPSFVGAGSDPIVQKAYTSHDYPYYQYTLAIVGDQYPYSARYMGFGLSVGGIVYGVGTIGYTVGAWCHAAGTYDGETLLFYVNGNLVASNSAPSGPINAFNTDLFIAAYRNYPAYTPVTLDELRIWNYARPQSAIRACMNRELTGAEPGLIAYYNFNQVDSSTLHDATGNHDATLYNVATNQYIPSTLSLTPNPVPAELTDCRVTDSRFEVTITGSIGFNYIVQGCNDLRTSKWDNLVTNSAPFSFVETNIIGRHFYRALSYP
jgi:hypothetical protein